MVDPMNPRNETGSMEVFFEARFLSFPGRLYENITTIIIIIYVGYTFRDIFLFKREVMTC